MFRVLKRISSFEYPLHMSWLKNIKAIKFSIMHSYLGLEDTISINLYATNSSDCTAIALHMHVHTSVGECGGSMVDCTTQDPGVAG